MNKIWDFKYTSRGFSHEKNIIECPFCNEKLSNLFQEKSKGSNHNENYDDLTCKVCQTCGWWSLRRDVGIWGPPTPYGDKFYGRMSGLNASLKNLDLNDIAIPIEEIRNFLIADYESRFNINPKLFEQTVGSVFSDLGYDVMVTGYTNDGGVDVILTKNNEEIGVQVKRYKNKIKVSQIRELIGALILKKIPNGIFITTSEFECGAYKIEKEIIGGSFQIQAIQLIDSKKFLEALKITQRESYKSKDEFLLGKNIDTYLMPSLGSFKGI